MSRNQNTDKSFPKYPPDPHRKKRAPVPKPISGPFKSCGTCPYASNGFVCYHKVNCPKGAREGALGYVEGDCMRTYQQKLNQQS